jgi:hypothetical protein
MRLSRRPAPPERQRQAASQQVKSKIIIQMNKNRGGSQEVA